MAEEKADEEAYEGAAPDKQERGRVTQEEVQKYQAIIHKIKREINKIVVGQEIVIEGMIRGLLCDGHVLVEGIPGIAKTLSIRALATATGCEFNRIQFTVDLLPSDIVGITSYDKDRGFYVIKGPLFAHFILADEINRAPPKTQSAMLEAMQERQATIGKTTYELESPFFVMATQNPIESEGVYSLPEAQIDRFLFKLHMTYPKLEEEPKILYQNITTNKFEDFGLKAVTTPEKLMEMQAVVKRVYLGPEVERYIVKLVDASRNPDKYHIRLGKYIEWGGSPRASIALFIAAKANALMRGNAFATPTDVKSVAHDILRHRIILNYEGQAEDIQTDEVVDEILKKIPVP
jgi:MoxR-like ATPase